MSESLRDYQKEIALKAVEVLKSGFTPYLAMEVRTGKTLTAFAVCYLMGYKRVLFVTRKLAMSSISNDYNDIDKYFDLTIINFDSLHKIASDYDCIIVDEAHSIGAFPKPSLRTKELKKIIERSNAHVILMSGTPNPESYSQLFHQFWVCGNRSPFRQHKNFYAWAKIYVNQKLKFLYGKKINDYQEVKSELIRPVIEQYFFSVSQIQAGFNQEIKEEVILLPKHEGIEFVVSSFIANEMYTFKDGKVILGDTGAKKMSKIHQLYSGTVKTEDGEYKKLIADKAEYIKNNYVGKKIAIYYIFISEGDILKSYFKNWTDNPEEFNQSEDKVFICQIQSGSMGVNLRTADYIIFYNIHFSSLLYWQARARMQDKNRTKESVVHWIFTEGGIEEKIYRTVLQKKDYTLQYYRKDYERTSTASKSNKKVAN